MDYTDKLTRRFSQLNAGKTASVKPINIHKDGHGTYAWTYFGSRKSVFQQFFVNTAEARSLLNGRNNKNLDSQLRL